MSPVMTSRERWLAALQMQPVDRLPFWPKLDASYAPYQAGPYSSMSTMELHRWIGSDPQVGGPDCVRVVRNRTRVETTRSCNRRRTVYDTPAGALTFVEGYDPVSHAYHPIEYPVKSASDIEAMRWVAADARYEVDEEACIRARELGAEHGEGAITVTSLGISPLMDWIQHFAGIDNGLLLLHDERQTVEALFEAVHSGLCRKAEIMADCSPYPVIYSVENTSTTLISPELFRRYCLPHLRDYGHIITGAGKIHLLHMCGKLKLLLSDIDTLPATGVEAFTTPPVGSTTFPDGRASMPRKCLIGGTNATLWLRPADEIADTIIRDLNHLPHRLGVIPTSAGVMPPPCPPEVIRRVAQRLAAYNPS